MGSGRMEQSCIDALSPWVPLVIIQQVFFEHLLCAWYCLGLSVLHLGKNMEGASRPPDVWGKDHLAKGTATAKT